MIAKIVIPLLLMILVPDIYIYLNHIRAKTRLPLRLLWWLPSLSMVIYTVCMGCMRETMPYSTYIFFCSALQ